MIGINSALGETMTTTTAVNDTNQTSQRMASNAAWYQARRIAETTKGDTNAQ